MKTLLSAPGLRCGYLPGQVQVEDEALAEFLREPLAMLDVKVVLKESLRYVDQAMAHMTEQMGNMPPSASLLEAEGMTVQRVEAFSQAAVAFYEAAPWRLLSDMDLVRIKSPQIDPDMGYMGVMGAGGQSFGLSFFNSVEQYQLMMQGGDLERIFQHAQRGLWGLTFDPASSTPYEDVDLWDDHDLVKAEGRLYPCLICSTARGKHKRPGTQVLTMVEGLMRVMAAVDDQTLDQLSWKATVDTFDGPMEFELVLEGSELNLGPEGINESPVLSDRRLIEREMQKFSQLLGKHPDEDPQQLLKQLHQRAAEGSKSSGHEAQELTPLEQAQELCYQALEQKGRRQPSLAIAALDVCEDCADAHIILGENASDVQQAEQHYLRGLEAARQVLGKDCFKNNVGHFWGIFETRPFMRAMLGLAQCANSMDNCEEAIEYYQEMLRLNPNDNQGVRDLLLPLLIELDHDKQASKLTRQYKWDEMAIFSYARALLSYRKNGDTSAACKLRKKAIRANPYVTEYLVDEDKMPLNPINMYAAGSQEEAVLCIEVLYDAWDHTPGAIDWIHQGIEQQSPTNNPTLPQ